MTLLSGFLQLFEAHGDRALPSHVVRERAGERALETLLDAGLLRDAGRMSHYECGGEDGEGCPRRVIEDHMQRDRPLVAVCGRSPAACEAVRLTEAECAGVAIDVRALSNALAELFGAEAVGMKARAVAPLEKLGEARTNGSARDVFLVRRPSDRALANALSLRERAARRTLVLVPTARDLAGDLAAQYGPGGKVELVILEDVLAVRKTGLVLREAEKASEEEAATRRSVRRKVVRELSIPKPDKWEDLRIHKVSESIVSIHVGRLHARCTYADLGMVDGRTRAPSVAWELLITLCESYGWCAPRGASNRNKLRLTKLRDALQRAFGLNDDPFRPYEKRAGWRARFQATDETSKALLDGVRRDAKGAAKPAHQKR